jgi:hypothetical protein
MTQTTEKNHAIENALGHLESIRALVARQTAADGCPDDAEGSIEQDFDEYPLSVEVRSGWQTVGDELTPAEYLILLTTGGPALRIVGQLGRYNEPENARLEWQDWGTPWTELHASEFLADLKPSEADDILRTFAQHFYFGEA